MDWLNETLKSIEKLKKIKKEPTKIWLSLEAYDELREEISRYMAYGIRDDDPYTIILDSDGSQIPLGKFYGLEVFIDKRLQGNIAYME